MIDRVIGSGIYPRELLLSLGLFHERPYLFRVNELIGPSHAAVEILDFYCYQIVTPEKEKLEISVYFFYC